MYDRIETVYDENSNPVLVIEQRDVAFVNIFDPGNRLMEQEIESPRSVPGITGQEFIYDSLNRLTSVRNDYARVDRRFDPLSRLIADEQSIRLDGNGFASGWEQPVSVSNTYDKQSNRLSYTVEESLSFGRLTSLFVTVDFDALDRQTEISAEYFETPRHLIVDYSYFGPRRVQTMVLGNGALLANTYDIKRRIESRKWSGPSGALVGFSVGYDRVDNAKSESFDHDGGLYDHFVHNDRYELTGVDYRSPFATPPTVSKNTFDYDDISNRALASFGGPFDAAPENGDEYVVNDANEFVELSRNGRPTDPGYDRAGNSTRFQVRPVTSSGVGDIEATVRWDPKNNLFDIETGVNSKQHYRYDPLGRRIASFELSGSGIESGSRRYIYSGSTVVEERVFGPFATLSSAPSVTERIYVNGKSINEPLLAAIDGDGDGEIRASAKNQPVSGVDQEYYFLSDHRGNIMALLDADDPDRLLEYYRYEAFGEATVLPIADADGDEAEDTPFDLTDNNANIMLQRELSPTAGMKSDFGNPYLFAAQRFDWQTGLYFYGCRYYEATSARFIQRVSEGCPSGNGNAYAVEANNPLGPEGDEDFDPQEGGCSLPGPGGSGPGGGGFGPCGDCSGLSCKGLAPGPHMVLCPGGTALCVFNCPDPVPYEPPCVFGSEEFVGPPPPLGHPDPRVKNLRSINEALERWQNAPIPYYPRLAQKYVFNPKDPVDIALTIGTGGLGKGIMTGGKLAQAGWKSARAAWPATKAALRSQQRRLAECWKGMKSWWPRAPKKQGNWGPGSALQKNLDEVIEADRRAFNMAENMSTTPRIAGGLNPKMPPNMKPFGSGGKVNALVQTRSGRLKGVRVPTFEPPM